MGLTGVAVGLSGCLGGDDSGESDDGLEYSETDTLDTREGVFDSDFYHVNLDEGEWSKVIIEAPGNQAAAVFLDVWDGSCSAAFLTKRSFENDFPDGPIDGRIISHRADADTNPAFTIGEASGSEEWVALVDNTDDFGPTGADEPVEGYFAIGKRIS